MTLNKSARALVCIYRAVKHHDKVHKQNKTLINDVTFGGYGIGCHMWVWHCDTWHDIWCTKVWAPASTGVLVWTPAMAEQISGRRRSMPTSLEEKYKVTDVGGLRVTSHTWQYLCVLQISRALHPALQGQQQQQHSSLPFVTQRELSCHGRHHLEDWRSENCHLAASRGYAGIWIKKCKEYFFRGF